MARRIRGFTLSELMVVIAVIALVAAITFPVMRAAKEAAKKTVCATHFRQVQLASSLYMADYEDRFMLVNYQVNRPDNSQDRTWVQLVLPYLATFDIFKCPSDYRRQLNQDALIDIDLVPGDTFARYYQASQLSNIGYNYLYLSPASRQDTQWMIEPRNLSQISDSTSMVLFVDSTAVRRPDQYTLTGGGSYIVAPPCRFVTDQRGLVDSFQLPPTAEAYAPTRGWNPGSKGGLGQYGRAWPRHNNRATVTFVGGNTRSLTMSELSLGCEVREGWQGRISSVEKYFWDFE